MSRRDKAIEARRKAARWVLYTSISFWVGVWFNYENTWWWLTHLVLFSSSGLDYVRWKLYFAQSETLRMQRESIQDLEHAIRVRMNVLGGINRYRAATTAPKETN